MKDHQLGHLNAKRCSSSWIITYFSELLQISLVHPHFTEGGRKRDASPKRNTLNWSWNGKLAWLKPEKRFILYFRHTKKNCRKQNCCLACFSHSSQGSNATLIRNYRRNVGKFYFFHPRAEVVDPKTDTLLQVEAQIFLNWLISDSSFNVDFSSCKTFMPFWNSSMVLRKTPSSPILLVMVFFTNNLPSGSMTFRVSRISRNFSPFTVTDLET